MTTRRLWLLGLALATLAAAIFVIAWSDPERGVRSAPTERAAGQPTLDAAPKRAPVPGANPAAPSPPAVLDAEIDALDRAVAAADPEAARAAARDLRRRLRTEPEALARAVARFLDPSTRSDVRMALALILGTLPGDAGDAPLLRALERFATDAAFVRCALLALGAQREPEDDDDVFGLGDRPHGAAGPGGLGITVRRAVVSGDVERTVAAHLARSEPEVRWAAARALGHALESDSIRASFLAALASEPTDDVAAALGKPLAAWAGSATRASDREAVVAALLLRAGDPGLDAYRFRMEEEFDRMAVPARERAALADLARPGHPYGVRAFALTALARGAARGGEAAASDARRALEASAADEDSAVRDLATRWLGRLPYDRDTASRLAALAGHDLAWNVRFTALESLAAIAPRAEAIPVLRAAQGDPDPRVAERADALLRGLSGTR